MQEKIADRQEHFFSFAQYLFCDTNSKKVNICAIFDLMDFRVQMSKRISI
jgi:hypothetical protein